MENKVVRIISYQNAKNYGAVLQAYGLQQTIKMLGFEDVAFINYNPTYLSDRYNPFKKTKLYCNGKSPFQKVKHYFTLPFNIWSRLRLNRIFNASVKRMLNQKGPQYTEYHQIKDTCDTLICGSDQIWNTRLTGSLDKAFFGYGEYKRLSRIISYAPSTELVVLDDLGLSNLTKHIEKLDAVSVREQQIHDRLQPCTSKEIEVCVDPTILCGGDEFSKIAAKRVVHNNYILVYAYDANDTLIQKIVRSIPNWKDYEVHTILFGAGGLGSMLDRRMHGCLSVEEFLSMFKYASYVVTNSFHGLAFSLLFHKSFNVGYLKGYSTRCESLLSQINRLDKLIIDKKQEPNWDNWDYIEIDKSLSKIRNKSLNFLKNNI